MGLDMYDTGWDDTEWDDVGWDTEPVAVAEPVESSAYSGDIVLGVVMPTFDTTYSQALLSEISSEASYYGWEVNAYSTDAVGSEEYAAQMLASMGVDVIIIDPYGLDDASLQSLAYVCAEMGVPCVMLLDEGESAPDYAGVVSLDLVNAGRDMALNCSDSGEVFIIGGYYGSEAGAIEEGLIYDPDYSVFRDRNVVSVYTEYELALDEVISQGLAGHPDVETFICVDPDLAYETLIALESIGFTGDLICYTTEPTMEEMDTYGGDIYVTYEYFSISEIAYYCVMAAADQIEYDMEPQQYVLTSYSW